MAPIDQGGDEAQGGEEVSGEFVVEGGDGSDVLDAAVGALNDVAPLVASKGKRCLRLDLLGMTAMVPRLCRRARIEPSAR